jgi:hypothetical protein
VPLNRRWTVLAGCLLAGLAVSGPARAASSGVHVDPNSPEGKEYAIPLQAARSQGSGPSVSAPATTTRGAGSHGQSPPAAAPPAADSGLFGAGISRTSTPHRTRSAKPTASLPVTAPPVITAADRRPASGGGGGSTAIFWVGAALAALIPGLAVGIGVRRWRQA